MHAMYPWPPSSQRMCIVRVHLDPFARQKNCGAGTLKHGAFEFERGRPKREGGRSATVCRFGENPALHTSCCALWHTFFNYLTHIHLTWWGNSQSGKAGLTLILSTVYNMRDKYEGGYPCIKIDLPASNCLPIETHANSVAGSNLVLFHVFSHVDSPDVS